METKMSVCVCVRSVCVWKENKNEGEEAKKRAGGIEANADG